MEIIHFNTDDVYDYTDRKHLNMEQIGHLGMDTGGGVKVSVL